MIVLVALSIVLFGVRLWAAGQVGFGDSEALYASWAVHRQPAYLDHPGFVGVVARAIGEGGVPSPGRAHVFTALVATLVPWLFVAVARAAGAEQKQAIRAGLVVAVVPEIAVGLFALTPDFLLAPAWLGALGCAIVGLGSPPNTTRSSGFLLGAGLLAGIASAAKVSGLLLIVSLVTAYVSVARANARADASTSAKARSSRTGTAAKPGAAARTFWPWAGILAGLVVVAPIVHYEARTGFSMLRHRLVDTQHDAGLALANLGGLVGGQLVYVSPLLVVVAVIVARDLVRHRNDDATSRVLFHSFAIPFLPLVALCLWSHVAEPHWIAPALLALPIHAARRAKVLASFQRRRLVIAGAGLAAILTVVAHVWVLVPSVSARLFPADADPKIDIASELYGWPTVIDAVKEQMAAAATPYDPEGREVVVVGPHWTICAQLHAGLPGIRVGCATPIPDDFDRWLPRDEWRKAENVLFVTDNRFGGDGAEQLPAHVRHEQSRVRILRGGRTARVFELYLYSRRASSMARSIP